MDYSVYCSLAYARNRAQLLASRNRGSVLIFVEGVYYDILIYEPLDA